MNVTLTILAYLSLTAAFFGYVDRPEPVGLAMLLVALAAALVGCWKERAAAPGANPGRLVILGLVALATAELIWMLRAYIARSSSVPYMVSGLVVLTVLVGSYVWRGIPWPRLRFGGILAVYAVLATLVIRASPEPKIDVWYFQQVAVQALLEGRNPYTAEYPDPHANLRGPTIEGAAANGKLYVFPYPPLCFLAGLPGYVLFGDVRYSHLAAILLVTAFIAGTGWRLGVPAGHPAELAAVTLLCHPRGFAMLEFAFTEPLVAAGLAGAVWVLAGCRPGRAWLPLACGLAVKQYAVLCLPGLWATRRLGARALLGAILAAGLVTLPFFLWAPKEFWRSVISFNAANPFETDCLSISAWLALNTGEQLSSLVKKVSSLVGFGAAFGVMGLVSWRAWGPMAPGILGTGATFLAFFMFNRAAPMNYYWLVATLFSLAVMVAFAESTAATDKENPSPAVPQGELADSAGQASIGQG
jgi:hypothetical protein